MMKINSLLFTTVLFSTIGFIPVTRTFAQVIPDQTLPKDSFVIEQGNLILIEGGTTTGQNLFHSFKNFSIPTGSLAIFRNGVAVDNIISRITGDNPSFIDGILSTQGSANLFFLNPNGIIFGPNAILDIGGSFVGTTAQSILFADGAEFSSQNPYPTLTLSVPIGLGFNKTPKTITVLGNGGNLILGTNQETGGLGSPILGTGASPTGLRTRPQKSIALVGGDIDLVGGIITAFSGNIQIGSVGEGQVFLKNLSSNLTLDYGEIKDFKNIKLDERALLDASGFIGGNISLTGKNIFLERGVVAISNFGNLSSGKIEINAQESVSIGPPNEVFSPDASAGVLSQNFFSGQGATIEINAPRIRIRNLGNVNALNFGEGRGGNINVKADKNLEIIGQPGSVISSFILNQNVGDGRGGNITIDSADITIKDQGVVTIFNLGKGLSGDLTITGEEVKIIGGGKDNVTGDFIPSSLCTITLGQGAGGNISLQTKKVFLQDGGLINATTVGKGNAGNINLVAEKLIEISNPSISNDFNEDNISRIVTSADIPTGALREQLSLSVPEGNSGDIVLKTREFRISNQGQVTVRNEGLGQAGNLTIEANIIDLNNLSQITATTASGEGGNITVSSNDMRLKKSEISATAGVTGNGGNISIDTDFLILFDDSSITANAFAGRGGNIDIKALGLFVSPNAKITASSELGVDGTVRLETIETLDKLAIRTIDPMKPIDENIAKSCLTDSGTSRGTFTYTGASGLPLNPTSGVDNSPTIIKIPQPPENFTPFVPKDLSQPSNSQWKYGDPIVEATARIKTADGRILLVSKPPEEPYEVLEVLCNLKKDSTAS
jgi:filamentous hemagglutinin family protein